MAVLFLLLGFRSRRCRRVTVRVLLRGRHGHRRRPGPAAPTSSWSDGVIQAVAPDIGDRPAGTTVLDASGCLVAPGLVDLHTHLREPGREEAETVETGARAAALGGYTAVVAMPNTEPAIDSAAVVRQVLELGAGTVCDVRVAGAITVGRAGTRWRRWPRWRPSGSGCSPTTAPACRTPG